MKIFKNGYVSFCHETLHIYIYIYIYIYICINGLEYIANNILVNFYVKLALVNFING